MTETTNIDPDGEQTDDGRDTCPDCGADVDWRQAQTPYGTPKGGLGVPYCPSCGEDKNAPRVLEENRAGEPADD